MKTARLSRRDALAAAAGLGWSAVAGSARAAPPSPSPSPMPVLLVSHGSPRLPLDPVRSGELRAWGRGLPKPRGILVMTPHFAERRIALGPTGRGFGMYNMPGWMKRQLPRDLDYPTPPSEALATRVEALLSGAETVVRAEGRRGFDHTTWMPLSYLFPAADAPVLEITYPYRAEAELFALGQRLSPLRDEGVVIVASGQQTHNLASISFDEPVPVPGWSREFDRWGAEAIARLDVDALIDWRHRAPAAEIAHPDDGGHFRVFVFALGALVGRGRARGRATFPVEGFEGTMSKRGSWLTSA